MICWQVVVIPVVDLRICGSPIEGNILGQSRFKHASYLRIVDGHATPNCIPSSAPPTDESAHFLVACDARGVGEFFHIGFRDIWIGDAFRQARP